MPSLRQQQKASRLQRCICAAASSDYRQRENSDVRVLVVGATGYIGKFVVKELINRGYNVVPFAREKSGVGGKAGMEDTKQVSFLHLPPSSPGLPNGLYSHALCGVAEPLVDSSRFVCQPLCLQQHLSLTSVWSAGV